jgi:cytochrome c5
MGFGKRSKFLVTAACLLAAVAVVAAGSETKGKFYFKKNCKTCHVKGAAGGEVTPLTKTQAQWKAYFAAGKHEKGKDPLSKFLTPEQMADVETFVEAHASDSPQPETCGG